MSKLKISILSSSVREGRESHKAALALLNELRGRDNVDPVLLDLKNFELPPLTHVRDKFPLVPDSVEKLGEQLDSSDGIIFVSPEYNGGYSSALKNAVDFFPKSTYRRKPIGITTASSGAMGGMRAAQQLLHLALALWAIPSPQMLLVPKVQEKFDDDGNYLETSFEDKVKKFVDEYVWLAGRLMNQESLI